MKGKILDSRLQVIIEADVIFYGIRSGIDIYTKSTQCITYR